MRNESLNKALNDAEFTGYRLWTHRRSVKHLRTILSPDEEVLRVSSATLASTRTEGRGIIVQTDRRIIFARKALFTRQTYAIQTNKISAVELNKSFLKWANIEIHGSGSASTFRWVRISFVEALQNHLSLDGVSV